MKLIDKCAAAARSDWWRRVSPDTEIAEWRDLAPHTQESWRATAQSIARVLFTEPPSDEMVRACREALRKGGLLPAYTDDAKNGQPPILHHLLKTEGWSAMSRARLAELEE